MLSEFMFSEESNSESENGTIVKRELPWRSEHVSKFFFNLDAHVDDSKSTFAKRQSRQWVLVDEPSTRGIPSGKFTIYQLSIRCSK